MRTHVEWEKIEAIPSGAKAQSYEANAQGLKPLPPKDSGLPGARLRRSLAWVWVVFLWEAGASSPGV
jgi:hypothetical protein